MLNTNKQILCQPQSLNLKFLPRKSTLVLEGPLGVLQYRVRAKLNYLSNKKKFWLSPRKFAEKSIFCLNQILLTEHCLGVTLGFRRQLNLVGIGYKASLEKIKNSKFLVLKLGYSHSVKILIPESLDVRCPKPRLILITGISLQKVNNFAALVRDLKLPNPYKEKGLYYKGEILNLKQGKKT